MPLAALICNNLTTPQTATQRPLALGWNGLDIIRRANGVGVPIESVVLTESAGDLGGAASTLVFTLEDPLDQLTAPKVGEYVYLVDTLRAEQLFGGFILKQPVTELATGRSWAITCIGMERLLDWATLPADLTLRGASVGPMAWAAIVQSIAAATSWPFDGIRYTAPSPAGVGSDAFPVGDADAILAADVTLTAGSSFRKALDDALNAAIVADDLVVTLTIRPNGALRTFGLLPSDPAGTGTDYLGTMVVSAGTTAGTLWAADFKHGIDGGQLVRAVYVTGAAAASTGLVRDGTGLPGVVATTTTLGTDLQSKLDAAQQKLQLVGERFDAATEGSLRLEDWTPSAGFHPPAAIQLNALGLVDTNGTPRYRTTEIERRFVAGGLRHELTISYGTVPPSFARST